MNKLKLVIPLAIFLFAVILTANTATSVGVYCNNTCEGNCWANYTIESCDYELCDNCTECINNGNCTYSCDSRYCGAECEDDEDCESPLVCENCRCIDKTCHPLFIGMVIFVILLMAIIYMTWKKIQMYQRWSYPKIFMDALIAIIIALIAGMIIANILCWTGTYTIDWVYWVEQIM